VTCPLCESDRSAPFAEAFKRRFFRCSTCALTFVDRAQIPSEADEKARYALHRNDAANPGYAAFLYRAVDALLTAVAPPARGLDFGSGPNPVLARMLGKAGFEVTTFDRFFAPRRPPAGTKFDFVTCIETAEHFHVPALEFKLITSILKPGGVLVVSTELLEDDAAFAKWRYARDFTHVCFYKKQTMEWIAGRFGWNANHHARNIEVFRS